MRTLLFGLTCSLALSACGDEGAAPRDGGALFVDAGADLDAAMFDAGDASALASNWRSEPPLPVVLQEISAVTLDGRIWVVGGFEDFRDVGTVRIFDPSSGAWTLGPALPAPRHHLALAVVGGDLYVLGGMETIGFDLVDTAWVLRAGASEWTPLAPLPEARGAGYAGVVDGTIYLVGGQGPGEVLSADTLIYDPATNAWTIGAAIPSPREHLAGFVYDGEIWALGGRAFSLSTNTAVVEIYDPATDTWRSGLPLGLARGGFAASVLDDVAYVVGGEQPDRALHEVEALHLPRGAWRTLERVPTPRHGHAMATAAGRIWVIGGADEPIFAAVNVVESFAP